MSEEKTVEELQDAIQKLKDKNYQLIGEKKRLQGERDEAQEQISALQSERDDLAGKYNYLTVELPREELFNSIAVAGAGELLQRELLHHYNIGKDEDGNEILQDKEGQPVEVEGKPVAFSADGIRSLYTSGKLPALGTLLLGNQSSGGGATGSKATGEPAAPKTRSNSVQFGMR